jgi:hypothetical protein
MLAPIAPNDCGPDALHISVDVMAAAGPSGVCAPSACRNDPGIALFDGDGRGVAAAIETAPLSTVLATGV